MFSFHFFPGHQNGHHGRFANPMPPQGHMGAGTAPGGHVMADAATLAMYEKSAAAAQHYPMFLPGQDYNYNPNLYHHRENGK